MLLYMVRHGESEANERHIHAGWGQVRLTAKGREDAKKAKALLCDISFDKVYAIGGSFFVKDALEKVGK